MSLSIDTQFVTRLSPYLKSFKHKGGYKWNCRCPLCGDSKLNKIKARGWFLRGKKDTSDMLLYNCFNCGASTTLGKIIQHISTELYDEYRFAVYRENIPEIETESEEIEVDLNIFKISSKKIEITYDAALDDLFRLDKLSINHPAVKYVLDRKIPKEVWHLFYFAPKFMTWTNTLIKDKFQMRTPDYPRLIIPFLNQHGKMFGFAARAFGAETPKYYTIKLDENEEKIYGRERLNYSKQILVVEGQVDSLLLDNCISVSGSSFITNYTLGIITNCTLVYDREPRNPEIVRQIKKSIDAGFKVCLLPETFPGKDINEAIIAGLTKEEITKMIEDNSYQGLAAEIKFADWNMCAQPKKFKPNTNDLDCLAKYR